MLSISTMIIIYVCVVSTILLTLIMEDNTLNRIDFRIFKDLKREIKELIKSRSWERPIDAHLDLKSVPFPMRYYAMAGKNEQKEIEEIMHRLSRSFPSEKSEK